MNQFAGVIAARLGRPSADIAAIEDAIAIDPQHEPFERAALLLLTVLAGASPETAALTGAAVAGLRDDEGSGAVSLVAGMLHSLATTDSNVATAFASTVSAVQGDWLTVVVSIHTDDGVQTFAFSADGKFVPYRDRSVSLALTVPGRLLLWIARDVASIAPPVERRPFAH